MYGSLVNRVRSANQSPCALSLSLYDIFWPAMGRPFSGMIYFIFCNDCKVR